MKRTLLIASLAFGTVAGYTSGLHHLARSCHRNDRPPAATSPAPLATTTTTTDRTDAPCPAAPDHPPAMSGPE